MLGSSLPMSPLVDILISPYTATYKCRTLTTCHHLSLSYRDAARRLTPPTHFNTHSIHSVPVNQLICFTSSLLCSVLHFHLLQLQSFLEQLSSTTIVYPDDQILTFLHPKVANSPIFLTTLVLLKVSKLFASPRCLTNQYHGNIV